MTIYKFREQNKRDSTPVPTKKLFKKEKTECPVVEKEIQKNISPVPTKNLFKKAKTECSAVEQTNMPIMDSKDEKIEKYIIADRTYTTDYDKMLPLHFLKGFNKLPLRDCDMIAIKEWLGNRLKLNIQEIEAIKINYGVIVTKTGKFENALIRCHVKNNIYINLPCFLAESKWNSDCHVGDKTYYTQNMDIRNLRVFLAKEANEITKKYKNDF
jgi:hypothetical protein